MRHRNREKGYSKKVACPLFLALAALVFAGILCMAWANVQSNDTSPSRKEVMAMAPNAAVARGNTAMNSKTIATEKTRLVESGFEVNSLAWSPDGKYLATTGILTKNVNIWDVENERVVRTLKSDLPGPVFDALAYSPDGHYVVGCQGTVQVMARIWNPNTGDVVKDLGEIGPGACRAVAFSPNGDFLALGIRRNSAKDLEQLFSVAFFDTTTWRLVKKWIIPGVYVDKIAFSPDSRLLAIGGHRATSTFPQGVVELWDIVKNGSAKSVTLRSNTDVASLAYSVDGRFIAAGTSTILHSDEVIHQEKTKAIRVWNIADDVAETAATKDVTVGTDIRSLHYTSDGQYLISGGDDSTVRIWDAGSNKLIQILRMPNSVFCVAVRSDSTIVAASTGKLVLLWTLKKQ